MNENLLHAFATTHRQPGDALYLLINPLAECDTDDALHWARLADRLGEEAITRVLRADLAYDTDASPALITLAAPNTVPDVQLLAHIDAKMMEDFGYRKRYVCGVLASPLPAAELASAIAALCHMPSTANPDPFLPLFEPLRLELLAASLRGQEGNHRERAQHHYWLYPSSWGSFALFKLPLGGLTSPLPDIARHAQRDAALVSDIRLAWHRSRQVPLAYAPNRWTGKTLLPPQAAAMIFRAIRDARALGLRDAQDIELMALHQFHIHPRLPEHPQVRADAARAARGETSLRHLFLTDYGDAAWRRIVAHLDAQRSPS